MNVIEQMVITAVLAGAQAAAAQRRRTTNRGVGVRATIGFFLPWGRSAPPLEATTRNKWARGASRRTGDLGVWHFPRVWQHRLRGAARALG